MGGTSVRLIHLHDARDIQKSQRCAGTGSEGTGIGSEVPGEANARMKPYDRIKKVEALISIVHCNRDSTYQYLSYFSLHASS